VTFSFSYENKIKKMGQKKFQRILRAPNRRIEESFYFEIKTIKKTVKNGFTKKNSNEF
jgi:hypothetical protein